MIYLYTGTPGSGKSLHVARDIISRLGRKGGLICNFPVNTDYVKKKKGDFVFKRNSELTVDYLVDYAKKNHLRDKENQSLIVIDEAQRIFNCRDFSRGDRPEWVTFFSEHRHFGYNVVLIVQNDRMLDRQIRALVEYEVKHRKVNNYGFGGILLSLTMMTWFVAVERWYGMQGKEGRLGASFFPFQKKYSKIYDSYMLFNDDNKDNKTEVEDGRDPLAGGSSTVPLS